MNDRRPENILIVMNALFRTPNRCAQQVPQGYMTENVFDICESQTPLIPDVPSTTMHLHFQTPEDLLSLLPASRSDVQSGLNC